jgi:tRNA (mo5U34)-methyltransferase
MPWRKGPFTVHGIHIDTEWRSDWKWDRVLPHISPLAGRYVLDVGCGSGYHLWRMVGKGSRGRHRPEPAVPLPVRGHPPLRWQRPARPPAAARHSGAAGAAGVDTVFSMGVLYHRKSPIEHIEQLRNQLKTTASWCWRPWWWTATSTTCWCPPIATARCATSGSSPPARPSRWVERCGFTDVRIVDENMTSTDEQRRTDWMINESLSDYLDPTNPALTVEGHPAPKRAVLIARKAKD